MSEVLTSELLPALGSPGPRSGRSGAFRAAACGAGGSIDFGGKVDFVVSVSVGFGLEGVMLCALMLLSLVLLLSEI